MTSEAFNEGQSERKFFHLKTTPFKPLELAPEGQNITFSVSRQESASTQKSASPFSMASESKQPIVLFDLPSKQGTAWSLNPWKTRLVLNYKNLDYRTEWVEYPDLKTRFEPHVPGGVNNAYTIPTIMLPDGTYYMESRQIAGVIEQAYPEPSLHLDSPILQKVMDIMPKLMPALRGNYIPVIPQRILNEASLEYWYATREKTVGMKLDELEKTAGGEKGFVEAEPKLKEITALLKAKSDGPFFDGNTVTYADFVWVGFLVFWQTIGNDKFELLLKHTGDAKVHEELLKAVEPWSKRNDH